MSRPDSIEFHAPRVAGGASLLPADAGGEGSGADDIPQRLREIAMWRGLGYSFREIGDKFGVSPQAVSLMLSRHQRTAKSLQHNPELQGLSARAVNVLGRHSIKTREEARARNILVSLPRENNCGRKTAEEIRRWLET